MPGVWAATLCLVATLPCGSCPFEWPVLSPGEVTSGAMVTSELGMLPGTMSRSVVLLQLESVISVAPWATKDHMNIQGLGHILRAVLSQGPWCHLARAAS